MTTDEYSEGPRFVDMGILEKTDHETCKKMLARLSKGLAHPARIEIIRMLSDKAPEKPYICSDIVKALPLAQASVSQHLKILKETGWVYGENDGPRIKCSLVGNIMEFYRKLTIQAVQKQ
ncbi:MAG TPA: metalloregulator ArsR/SmtB family transcription factor [Syntrophales bacterium]|nr:metalloregulator ArsR/SmtB family transcription factor [Syntrophales bacterium]HPQ43200.1 metalloregulator ArsR/SmtB family transcription factor [Syntrophales bacterium]